MNIPFIRHSDDESALRGMDNLYISWQEFNSQHETSNDCFEVLLGKIDNDEGRRCKHCGSLALDREYGSRVGTCRSCHKTTRLTAGTFLHGIRKPRAWLGAIWLLEQGEIPNASQFHRLADVAYSTAWEIYKKLSVVIHDRMKSESHAAVLSSALFVRIFSRRSLKTPADDHPIAEQTEIEKQVLVNTEACLSTSSETALGSTTGVQPSLSGAATSSSAVSPTHLSASAQTVYECLSDEPVSFEVLCNQANIPAGPLTSILVMLELDELVVSLPGNKFARPTTSTQADRVALAKASCNPKIAIESSNNEDTIIGSAKHVADIIDFVIGNFQGIARKYLQLYLAIHWCHIDKEGWPPGSLLKACRRFRTVSSDEIRAFVTPRLVKVIL